MKNQIYLMCFLLSLHMTMFAQRQSYYKMQDGTTIFLERVDSLNYVKFKTQTAVTQRSRVLQKYNSSLSSSNTSYSMVRINNTLDLATLSTESEVEKVYPVYRYSDGTILTVTGEIFVKTNDGVVIEDVLDQLPVNYSNITLVQALDNTYHMSITETDCLDVCNRLADQNGVVYAEPDFVRFAQLSTNYTQWGLSNIVGEGIFAYDAWTITKGNSNVKIAVLDVGVELDHSDLKQNLLSGFDAVQDNVGGANGSPKKGDSHGTLCTGIIAALDNDQGITGVSPFCKIIPIRIAYGVGGTGIKMQDNWTVAAFTYAQNAGADILNCSWSKINPSSTVSNIINQVANNGRSGRGCTIVFSTGNDSLNAICYPAYLESVIAVGATDWFGNRSPFSNYGYGIDIVAPGENCYTTNIYNSYASASGTSFAAPHVAGVVALMLSVNPSLTRSQVAEILYSTCYKSSLYSFSTNAPYGAWNSELGYGLVNAYMAVGIARFEYSGAIREIDKYTYKVSSLPPNSRVEWSCNNDFVVTQQSDSVIRLVAKDYGKSAVLRAKVFFNNVLYKEFSKNISSPSALDIEGHIRDYISCCGLLPYKMNYIPYNASCDWTVSDNVDVDSKKDGEIRVSRAKGTSSGYWIEAKVNLNGRIYNKRKELTLMEKASIDMEILTDTYGPYGSRRFAFLADILDTNGKSMWSTPEATTIVWHCYRTENSGTEEEASIVTSGIIDNDFRFGRRLLCSKSIPHPGFTSLSITPIDPIEPPVIDPIQPYQVDIVMPSDPRCKLKVTLPDPSYEGIVTCVAYDDCTAFTMCRYLIDQDGATPYEGTDGIIVITPMTYQLSSPVPANDIISVKRTEFEVEGQQANLMPVKLLLYNDYGIVRATDATSDSAEISMNVSNLPDGTYYLNVVVGSNAVIRRIVTIKH